MMAASPELVIASDSTMNASLSTTKANESSSAMLDTKAAALYIGVSRQFLEQDRLTRRHGIPFHKIGRSVRYKLGDIDTWLSTHRHGGV